MAAGWMSPRIGPGGEMLGVEIKVALADLQRRRKWPEYLDYCDLFYFAIPPDFPAEHVPPQTGLIVADRYGGAIVKQAEAQSLHASRRKAVTISFARCRGRTAVTQSWKHRPGRKRPTW